MLKLKQLSMKFLIFILFIFSNVQADFFEELYPRKMEAEITPTIEVIGSLPQNTEFMHVLGNSQNGFEYYDGIEKIPTEFALSYLVTQQNSDGSFGDGVN